MSSAIGNSTYGALATMLSATKSLQTQIGTLQQQTTTGLISQSYGGLGGATSQVLSLDAATSRLTSYTASINNAQGKASVMQDSLTQIQSIVTNMSTATLALTATSPASSVDTAAQQAKLALSQIAALMNSTYGGNYVFAGADTSHPPIPAASSITTSGMVTQIGAQVAALATVPSTTPVATVIANTVAIASSTAAGTTVFSSYLTGAGATEGAHPATVQIGDSQTAVVDLPANQNVAATSDPSIAGTGNAISDILRSLAVVANSTGAMVSNPDFATLMQNVTTTLNSAGSTLAQEGGNLGLAQTAMTAATKAHSALQTILSTQLTSLTDVDMASAISQLQAVTNQLTSSYKILSMASSLNLASYL